MLDVTSDKLRSLVILIFSAFTPLMLISSLTSSKKYPEVNCVIESSIENDILFPF